MAVSYKVEISSPKTLTGAAKVWTFSPDSTEPEHLASLDVELKKDKRRLSVATLRIHDPQWNARPVASLFNALPDPAYSDVPVKIWLAPPGAPRSPTSLVFEGKVTSLQPAFPAPSLLTIVATDRSIDARKQAQLRTFKNKSSTQIAEAIAKDYGFDVDLDVGDVQPKQRTVDIGYGASVGSGRLSDWDHLVRALASDGLEVWMRGSTLVVRRTQSTAYPSTFRHGDPNIISFVPMIEHVHGPGAGGDLKNTVAFQDRGTKQAVTGTGAAAKAAEAAGARTHRTPVAGQKTGTDGTHAEDIPVGWTNVATQLSRRKDTATLILTATPDLYLTHTVSIAGWGGKCDGAWYPEGIRHAVVGAAAATTTVSLHRKGSSAGAGAAGVVAFG